VFFRTVAFQAPPFGEAPQGYFRMSSRLATEPGAPSAEPPHLSSLVRLPALSSRTGLCRSLCVCTGLLSAPAFAKTPRGNFIHLVSNSTNPTSNFIVIRSLAKEAVVEFPTTPVVAERVDLDASRLESYVIAQRLALHPVFLHVSNKHGRPERRTVVGLRDDEVWRYEIGGGTRKIVRLGVTVPVNDALRAVHESAVVDSKVVLAYRPTIDLPNGDAAAEAGAPVFTFLKTGNAFYQVNRSGQGSFSITHIGILDSAD
jgi:hypothetical protein